MHLIARYKNSGFSSVADGVIDFFNRRIDLHQKGITFDDGLNSSGLKSKISTDISLVAIDRSDPEAFALSQIIIRGVTEALNQYLKERPLIKECCPEKTLFVNPIFNFQRYAPNEGFKQWHCDWSISDEATEPMHRVLAWILYCNDVESAGTEFHWQHHHEEAEHGKLIIFPSGISHIHKGRISNSETKTIATGWINAGKQSSYLARLAKI